MISMQTFGRTGHNSSRIIFGGYALSNGTKVDAEHALEILLEHGINHIDTAPLYGNAEILIGSWMEHHRDDFFLASKSRSRSYEGAWKDLQRSLERLNVEFLDLWQMHGLTNTAGWRKAMGPGGALEAFLEAREKGLVRFLGVTGHGTKVPGMHIRSLEHHDFDSVLLPHNYSMMQNPGYAAEFEALVDLCRSRNVAIQTIKSIARRPWEGETRSYNTYFYEPLAAQAAINIAVHWALGLDDGFVITAGDMRLLPMFLEAASRYQSPPMNSEMDEQIEEFQVKPIFR